MSYRPNDKVIIKSTGEIGLIKDLAPMVGVVWEIWVLDKKKTEWIVDHDVEPYTPLAIIQQRLNKLKWKQENKKR